MNRVRDHRHRGTASAPLLALAVLLAGCQPAAAQDPRAVVDRFVERADFNGVVLVAQGDSVVYARAAGYADVEAAVPTRLDTQYEVGSVAKWIASLVVLSLADEGTLALDEPVGAYLPEIRAGAGRRVTLHHLLGNRSGIPDGVVAAYREDPAALEEPLTTAEAVRRYASGDLLFEPGTGYDYSLSNWVVVQAVVERVTGVSLGQSVRERITRPVGLRDTDVFCDGSRGPRVAPGYEALAPAPMRADLPAPPYLVAAGGMYSTVPDLLALVRAVSEGAVLSESSLRALTTPYTEDDLGSDDRPGGYAYGGRVRTMTLGGEPRTALWLTGSNGPSKTRVSHVLPDGPTVVTITNAGTSPEETGALVEDVLRSLYR